MNKYTILRWLIKRNLRKYHKTTKCQQLYTPLNNNLVVIVLIFRIETLTRRLDQKTGFFCMIPLRNTSHSQWLTSSQSERIGRVIPSKLYQGSQFCAYNSTFLYREKTFALKKEIVAFSEFCGYLVMLGVFPSSKYHVQLTPQI